MIKKILGLSALIFLASCNLLKGTPPSMQELGLKLQDFEKTKKMALRPCTEKSICFASYQEINPPKRYLKPISYSEPKDVAFNKLLKVLLNLKGFKIQNQNSDYIYGTFEGPIGEVTDMEFDLRERGTIHFRAETRKLFFDFGMNRKRLEEIRFKYHQNDI